MKVPKEIVLIESNVLAVHSSVAVVEYGMPECMRSKFEWRLYHQSGIGYTLNVSEA